MTQPTSDLLIDRKRLKSHLAGWRALALFAIFGTVAFYVSGGASHLGLGRPTKDYIAQITIEGMMEDNQARDDMMKDIAEDPHAKAVLVRLDSPGGTTVAGEEIFLQLRQIAAKKPVVGVMHTLCASACYMASLATDHVVAREGTLTGSIGVLLQSFEVSELAKKIGIKSVSIKSGPYKDVPDIAEPFTDAQRAVVGEVVTDAYNHFVALIVDRRGMPDARVRQLADGRVYTGHQAAQLKLIDGIGGDDEALAWLSDQKHIKPDLQIIEMQPESPDGSILDKLTQYSGLKLFNHTSGLDGLVSIWHPSPIE